MENKILSYAAFPSSQEFEKWQLENPESRITSIAPFPGGIDFEQNEDMLTKAETKISVFVVYIKNLTHKD